MLDSKLSCCWSTLAIIFWLAPALAMAEDLSADAVIAKAIENRLAIKSYDIEIELDQGWDGAPVKAVHYYLHGDSLRVDQKYRFDDSNRGRKSDRFPGMTKTHYWDRRIYLPGKSINFSLGAVQIDTDPERTRENYAEAQERHDIRSLGFHTTGVTSGTHIENFLRKLSLPERSVRDEVLNGIDCKRVSVKLKSGIECDFWFAPSLGYQPIRARGHYPPYHFTDEINLTVKQWDNTGLWFPVSYSSSRNFSAFEMTERGTIKVCSLNKPLNPSTFGIAGLRVPVGRGVSILPSNGPASAWDGEKVVVEKR